MQKRTTNYSFQKFGDVFYSVNHNAGHLIDYVENDFKITNKSFDSFYYSSDPVYLDTKSGIIMLVVSKDGKRFEEYVIHRVVRLKPDIYFNYVSISRESVLQIHYSSHGMNQKMMQNPYTYQALVSRMNLKEIFTCFYQVRKSNYIFPGETHDYYELTYIDHGTLDTTVDGQKYRLQKYDLILYYPGQFHTQSTDDQSTCSYLTITFDMDNKLPGDLKNSVFHTHKDIYQVLSEFMKFIQSDGHLNSEMVLLYLKQILILLYQFDDESQEQQSITANPMQEHYESTLLNEILVFINNNVYKQFTVEDLCMKFSISRSSLQNLFKSNIHITPKQYISNVKLNQAKIMIHEHNQTISEISDILGFTSIHYFSRKFKLQYGISPTDYAKSISQ